MKHTEYDNLTKEELIKIIETRDKLLDSILLQEIEVCENDLIWINKVEQKRFGFA